MRAGVRAAVCALACAALSVAGDGGVGFVGLVEAVNEPAAMVLPVALQSPVSAHRPAGAGGASVTRAVGLVTHTDQWPASGPNRASGSRTGGSEAAGGVLAQGQAPGGNSTAAGQRIAGVLDRLRQWVVFFALALASVVFAIGGLRYLLANGDLGEIDAAKRAFKGAVIGYGIAALAQALASILVAIVGSVQ
jgi:type IV secretion system pilin